MLANEYSNSIWNLSRVLSPIEMTEMLFTAYTYSENFKMKQIKLFKICIRFLRKLSDSPQNKIIL